MAHKSKARASSPKRPAPSLTPGATSIVSKYRTETEKPLNRVVDAQPASDATLLVDDADALFGKRSPP